MRFPFYLVPCCFIFYDRGRVVLAAVSADSAGGVLGQSDTGGEPASRLVASCATQSNTVQHRATQSNKEQHREPASRLVASSATQGNKEKHRRGTS